MTSHLILETLFQPLYEKLSFAQLFAMSDPKRAVRSLTVKGPPLKIDAYSNALYYLFNFKSNPSTTGLRHHGYIKFLKPRPGVPLADVDCIVDCTCPDMRFVHSWSNKQRGAGVVGPNSLNQAINRAPRIKNPGNRPGCCKHVLALKQYIEGVMSAAQPPNNDKDASTALNKVVKLTQQRFPHERERMAQARERDVATRIARSLKNAGVDKPPEDVVDGPAVDEVPDLPEPTPVETGLLGNTKEVPQREPAVPQREPAVPQREPATPQRAPINLAVPKMPVPPQGRHKPMTKSRANRKPVESFVHNIENMNALFEDDLDGGLEQGCH